MRISTTKFIILIFAVILSWNPASLAADGKDKKQGPPFTDVITVLKAQKLENPVLLYWDGVAASAIGLKNPLGRPGIPSFDNSILDQFAFELSDDVGSTEGAADQEFPRFFIEKDAHGGAGRAGFLAVKNGDEEIWVNEKGIGHTGKGNTSRRKAGPPLENFASHSDGGMTLLEGITETVNGLISDNSLKHGGSRVIALIATGRRRNIKGTHETYPLILAVRTPIRRMDRGTVPESQERIIEALSLANVRRIIKGDFVNKSNIGFDGTFVDYGLMGLSTGYASITNQFQIRSMHEAEFRYGDKSGRNRAAFYIGKSVLSQMGIEEAKIERWLGSHERASALLTDFGSRFRKIVDTNGEAEVDNFAPATMIGKVDFRGFFAGFVADLLLSKRPHGEFVDLETSRLLSPDGGLLGYFSSRIRQRRLSRFVSLAASIVDDLVYVNREYIPDRARYAEGIRKIARYKNRNTESVTKRSLFNVASAIANKKDVSSQDVSGLIGETLNGAQLGTGPFSTATLSVGANAKATRIYIPAAFHGDGHHQPSLFPELKPSPKEQSYEFKLNLNGDDDFTIFESKLIETARGPFYLIQIPHDGFPVSDRPVKIVPVDPENNAQEALFYTTPPLILNERLGLEADLKMEQSLMGKLYDRPTRMLGPDLRALKIHGCATLMDGF